MFVDVEVSTNDVVEAILRRGGDHAFELIQDVDSYVADLDFTRRLYEYARGILVAEGEDV